MNNYGAEQDDKALLSDHFAQQPLFGLLGAETPQGYACADPNQLPVASAIYPKLINSRFNNNLGALTTAETQVFAANPASFLQNHYNSTGFSGMRAFEGPNPNAAKANHVVSFIGALMENDIQAHIAAGNPLNGLIDRSDPKNPKLGNRGFFDITTIPAGYFEGNNSDNSSFIAKAREAFIEKLAKNSEFDGLSPQQKDNMLNLITAQFFATLREIKNNGYRIHVEPNAQTTEGAENYFVRIVQVDQRNKIVAERNLDVLTLSKWDDFASISFSADQFKQVIDLYNNHANQPIGVNCTAGLGRSGVMVLAFSLLKDYGNYFDQHNYAPDLNAIDNMLSQMRAWRPGLVQQPEQYAMAIVLANQMRYTLNKGAYPTQDELDAIKSYTESTLNAQIREQSTLQQANQAVSNNTASPAVTEQQQVRPVAAQQQQAGYADMQQQQARPAATLQQQAGHADMQQQQAIPDPSSKTSPARVENLLNKKKLDAGDHENYALAIVALVKQKNAPAGKSSSSEKLARDLLSKLSRTDRAIVMNVLAHVNSPLAQAIKRHSVTHAAKALLTSREQLTNKVNKKSSKS